MPDPPKILILANDTSNSKVAWLLIEQTPIIASRLSADANDVLVLSANGSLVSGAKNGKPRTVTIGSNPPAPPNLAPMEQRLEANRNANKGNEEMQSAALDSSAVAAQMIAQIFFPSGSVNLAEADRQVIRQVVDVFQQQSQKRIMVVGHSSKGNAVSDKVKQQNNKIALARANSVARMIRAYGVAADQIVVLSRGADAPAFEETSCWYYWESAQKFSL